MRLSSLCAEVSASTAAVASFQYVLRAEEQPVRAVDDPDMIPLSTSARVSAYLPYICLQVFEVIGVCYADEDWLALRVVVTTRNSSISIIYDIVGDLIPGLKETILSADTLADEVRDALRCPVELLSTLTAGTALPDHRIKLKKVFLTMLLRSLDPASDQLNGAGYVAEDTCTRLLCR